MKNPNGYGTVYKLSGTRRRPWVAKVPNGWGRSSKGNAKQLYIVVGYFEKQSDALIALAEYQRGGIKIASEITLDEIYTAWSTKHYETLQPKSVLGYKGAYKKISVLHNAKFCELKSIHYEREIKRQEVTWAVAKMLKILLNLMYQYAIKNDIVDKNYAELIELPAKKQTAKKEIFTDIEIKKLWDNLDVEYVDSILILIYTGFRIGELLSLTRFNVDLDSGIIIGGIKTEAGRNRTVPINRKILPLVQKRYENAQTVLFPIAYRQYIDRFKIVLEQLGIKEKTPHCTRHTFATIMARGGADIKALQEIIGHADYSTTANIYTHLSNDDLKKAIENI